MSILEQYPDRARKALQHLMAGLAPAAPEPTALIVYGSLARGNYRPGESDINLAVVLHQATAKTLGAVRAPLRAAWREARVEPFLITRGEIPRLIDAFPIKLLDIKLHHHVLTGDDPFAAIEVDREHLRLRTEQELRNHLLRLRRYAIAAGDDPAELARAVYGSASSLAIELGALVRVSGIACDDFGLAGVIAAASRAFELDRGVLERVRAFREGGSEADVRGLYFDLMSVLEAAVAIADTMEQSS